MHYYQFNIADYRKDTAHLQPIEHYIYRTLIDWYYLDELPIPTDPKVVLRRLCLSHDFELQLNNVLSDFFTLQDSWYHLRIENEIAQYKAQIEQASKAGKASAEARANRRADNVQQNFNARSTTVQPTNNHKPITNNQEPLLNNEVDLPHAEAVIEKTNLAKIVFDEWAEIMNHPKSIMDAKRKRAIDARLKDGYTIDQLKQAILGCRNSEFHQGANDRQQVYDDIELICRTASNVDKFIQMSANTSKLSAAGQSTKAALERWLGDNNA